MSQAKRRSAYIYNCGVPYKGKKYSVDFYNLKNGKSIQYINARSYGVKVLISLLLYAGHNTYVEKEGVQNG